MTSAYEQGRIPEITMAHRLRIAREYAGLGQDELADTIGVSRNTVGNIEKERGKTAPRKIVINAWALACGVPVSWIINGGEPDGGGDGPGGGEVDPRRNNGLGIISTGAIVTARVSELGQRQRDRKCG